MCSCRSLPPSTVVEGWSADRAQQSDDAQSQRAKDAYDKKHGREPFQPALREKEWLNTAVRMEDRLLMRFDRCPDDQNPRCKGITLVPGDVLYLRRWWPGVANREAHAYHWAGPVSIVQRVPLRHVDPQSGHLYPAERELLATVLTVARSKAFNALKASSDNQQLRIIRDALKSRENELWNALVEGLRVRTLDPSSDGTADSPPTNFTQRDPNLFLSYRIDQVCQVLDAEKVSAYFDCGVLTGNHDFVERELFNIDQPDPSPWDTLVGERSGITTTRGAAYYSTKNAQAAKPADGDFVAEPPAAVEETSEDAERESEKDLDEECDDPCGILEEIAAVATRVDETNSKIAKLAGELEEVRRQYDELASKPSGQPWSTFNFVEVELGGLSLNRPGAEEAQWSLQDWEEAHVCKIDGLHARIYRVLLKGHFLPVEVVPSSATNEVVVTRSADGALERRTRTRDGACTACRLIRELDHADLQWLRASDVKEILWSVDVKDGDRIVRRKVVRTDACRPR